MRLRLLSSVLLLSACDGLIMMSPSGTKPGGEVKPEPGDLDAGTTSTERLPSPIRRLSAVEYTRSLARIFPGVTLPAITLPADARPFGFDNDANVNGPSALLVDAWQVAAQTVAQTVAASGSPFTCATSDAACPERVLRQVVRRAWRRPATDAELTEVLRIGATGPASQDARARVQLLIEALLLSPDFLYRFDAPASPPAAGAAQAPLDAYSLASRLSFMVTAAGPDDALLDAARDGRLDTNDGVTAELDRLLSQPESRDGVLHFFRQWFEVEKLAATQKLDADGFDAEMRAAIAEEFQRYVEAIVFDPQLGSVSDFFSKPFTFVNAKTAPLYGLTAPASGWQRVELDPTKRAGVLTQPLFLTTHAHPSNPSPVLRGVFILEKVMCVRVGSPPAAAQGITETSTGSGPTTNRTRYEATTQTGTCGGCHKPFINPPGFAFENFDTMGRRIEKEGPLDIDPTGSVVGMRFSDGLDLSRQLGDSAQVRSCVAERFARYAMGGSAWVDDPVTMKDLTRDFDAQHGNFRALLVAIVTHPEFRLVRF